jgi:hypothetical protein
MRRSNLKDAYLEGFSTAANEIKGADSQYNFSSSGSITISAEAAGRAATARAQLRIRFGKENAVLFNAAGCRLFEAENYEALANHVIALWQAEKWDDSYYVVTSLVEAQSSLSLMSKKADAEALIEATGDVPSIDLANARLKLKFSNKKSLALDIITLKKHTPLIGLSKLRPWWFTRDGQFEPSFVAPPDATEDTLKLRSTFLREGRPKGQEFRFQPDEEA